MNKLFLLIVFLLNSFIAISQCDCDIANCSTSTNGVSLFNIYYGSTVTLSAPLLPPLHTPLVFDYAWFNKSYYITPNAANVGTGFTSTTTQNNITVNPLDFTSNALPTDWYFMSRTTSSACSGCAPCFYGRSYKVHFLSVPPPITNQNISICQGQSIFLTATPSVGTCVWLSNSCSGTVIGTENSLTVSPATTTTYYVKAKNGSSTTFPNSIYSSCVAVTVTVNALPDNAGLINGSSSVCQGQNSVTYSVPTIANATSYLWTLPTGASGSSTTNSITLNFGISATTGNLSVKGVNSCGEGIESSLPITVNALPDMAGPISGATIVFQGQTSVTYLVSPISNAISYTWTLPTGASGSSTSDSIIVNFGLTATSGNINVYGTNSCGSGAYSSFGVTVNSLQQSGNNIGINTTTPTRNLDINNTLRIQPRSSAPSNPSKGDIYFDDTINKLRVFDGTVWQNCW